MRRTRLPALLLAVPALVAGIGGCTHDRGEVTLRFWAMGREGEVVEELAKEFERENPHVHVRVQQIPWTAAHEKLITSFVGNASPDLAQLGNTWVPEFEALDALEPLDARVAASRTVTPAAYFPGIWNTNVVDGHLYGVPWYVDTRVLFYRTDLLARAGYATAPATWAEWLKAMRKIKAQQGKDRYAIFLPTNEWAQPMILGMQAGAPMLKDDGRYGAFSDSSFRRAFDFYVDIFREGLAPVLGNAQMANMYEEFAHGFFAMYIGGPWNMGEFRRRLPDSLQNRWATAPLPGPTGAESGVSLAGGSSIVLFRSSAHKPEAWKLLEFLSRPEQQLRFSRLTGDLPAVKAAWQDSSLIGNRYVHAFWEQMQRVTPMPKVPEWELISSKLFDYAELSIRGGVAPDEALRRLDREVDRILEKRRWMMKNRVSGLGSRVWGLGSGVANTRRGAARERL